MGNCFGADARSRMAYQYFGDVITFNATYQTNRYKIPFVPFTGVNHRHLSMVFGCALLVNETTKSYIWLLKTWLNAMPGNSPSTIITYNDKAMAKVIVDVLPNATHRLCIWHLLQKALEQLSHVYNKYPHFQEEFYHCIHDTIIIEEFELEWSKIMEIYGLGDNDWLGNLYMRRERWVLAYLQSSFCAGISATQRSESMNKFFKDYVCLSTMISDFVYQYELALNANYLKEKEQDVKTKNSVPILKTSYKLEAEAAKVYTRKMLMKFQEELFCSKKYKASKYHEEGVKKICKVVPHGKESPFYEVHILAVLVKKSLVHFLPSHYILERWTINAKKHIVHDISSDVIQVEPQVSSTMMRNCLMLQFLKVAEESSIARLNSLVIANTLCSTSFVQDSLLTVTYPSTSSSAMHIHPNQSSFTDPLQQFQES
ncbi:protein FAR1-RELATED SEQUENCE 5-like [Quercus suber]|uniref:protein FAR1-RELATED SEQUENCE 5-like n=1 Tax=Quercus suber TaxID=58331 RepID=UPI0032DE5617